MNNVPWHIISTFNDVDDTTWAWQQLYNEVINSYIKTRKVKVRTNTVPLVDSKIRKQMNLRYKLWKIIRKQETSVLQC